MFICMLLAAIDIGTNAVRLFFSHVYEKGGRVCVEKTSLLRVPVRLGKDVFLKRVISPVKIEKLIKTMQAYKLLMEVNEPVAYRACATSAMREAKNGQEVIRQIRSETGIEVDMINGMEEAAIISSHQNFIIPGGCKFALFVDVGGGSTDLSLMRDGEVAAFGTFKIGTVRLLYQKTSPAEWSKLEEWLLEHQTYFPETLFVGTGGNINKIAKLYSKSDTSHLSLTRLGHGLEDLEGFTVKERIEKLGLRPDRADVITFAARIYSFIMQKAGVSNLFVPGTGLSDGIVHNLYRELKKNSPCV